MKLAIITINKDGENLAKILKSDLPNAVIFKGKISKDGTLKGLVKNIFNKYDGIIFMAALGITVRLINGLIKDKFRDPAIVSVDTAGRFSISVLSGHEGGANKLAYLVAGSLGAMPVITTGGESHKKIILGIGTRRGIGADDVKDAIRRAIGKIGAGLDQIRLVSTIDLKKDELGLIEACSDLGLPISFISKDSVKNFKGSISKSKIVMRHMGLDGVCEPCALLAGRRASLILKKSALHGVAIALAREDSAS